MSDTLRQAADQAINNLLNIIRLTDNPHVTAIATRTANDLGAALGLNRSKPPTLTLRIDARSTPEEIDAQFAQLGATIERSIANIDQVLRPKRERKPLNIKTSEEWHDMLIGEADILYSTLKERYERVWAPLSNEREEWAKNSGRLFRLKDRAYKRRERRKKAAGQQTDYERYITTRADWPRRASFRPVIIVQRQTPDEDIPHWYEHG